ncbi:hypothetical protein HYPSUDRAFT_219140, partial [Hypholoma sublateritium FD-334 SS-4]
LSSTFTAGFSPRIHCTNIVKLPSFHLFYLDPKYLSRPSTQNFISYLPPSQDFQILYPRATFI